jgi:putative ABC transport system substrate-binding protein
MGLKIEGRQVNAPQDFMSALNGLSRNVDALWGVADQLVLNSLTAKHFLLYSIKNATPFVGLSSVWVKAGSLYALESDYTDSGMQCGEMAFKVIQGTKVSSIPPASPRKITYSLNMNTARLMKIQIPEKLIQEAKQIY